MSLTRDCAARITRHFQPDPPDRLAVAISGGGDSSALLHLLQGWATNGGPSLFAVTVDHRLRPESAQEARQVAAQCRTMGIAHETLVWQGWDGGGNLSDQARRARYGLMADWARRQGICHVALGHTADDQAETLLMRLARQAGLDGLAAMAPRWQQDGVWFHRPALDLTRADLRAVLGEAGLGWLEDPSNDDQSYRRPRARQALAELASLGVTAEGLAQVAAHLAEARDTLGYYASLEVERIAEFTTGDITLTRQDFENTPPEIARRILQAALKWVSGAGYGARGASLTQALADLRVGQGLTLQGCRLDVGPNLIRIAREYDAVKTLRARPNQPWDGRWRLHGPAAPGQELRALGPDGRALCPDWRDGGLPCNSIEAGPAIWQGDRLIAAPLAGLTHGWSFSLCRDVAAFHCLLKPFALK